MSFFVYILQCADGSYYTGHTDNLEQRLAQHQLRYFPDCYTANRLPVELKYQQAFPSREEALAAEQKIKGWSRKKKEAMMRGDWSQVSHLARSYSAPSEPQNPVHPKQPNPVHPKQPNPVHPEQPNPVHPEPVEGCGLRTNNEDRANHPSTPLRVNGDCTNND
ncbi:MULTISPECIES: GIY-YIG nuclease family protein [unclassified Endozoicomonas]|uniref:GIY-YIG nuclease family protein n=1 Tax=unclassified Endozoicomonas TaxID=2644528 RepID=UPI003BB7734C